MSAVVRDIRAFQSAVKFKDRPNVYRSIVRDICAEQRDGRTGFAAVRHAKRPLATPHEPPKSA